MANKALKCLILSFELLIFLLQLIVQFFPDCNCLSCFNHLQVLLRVLLNQIVQLTMSGKRCTNKGSKKKDEDLSDLLKINSQYQQLLHRLTQNNYLATQLSPQAYLFSALQNIKQLNSCLKKQLNHYNRYCNPALEEFIKRKELINAGNLIGKYQNFNDEIETYSQNIEQLRNNSSQESLYQTLQQQEKSLELELKRLSNRRIELRNKTEIIAYQIECGETDLNSLKIEMFQEEIKLRKMEKEDRVLKEK